MMSKEGDKKSHHGRKGNGDIHPVIEVATWVVLAIVVVLTIAIVVQDTTVLPLGAFEVTPRGKTITQVVLGIFWPIATRL